MSMKLLGTPTIADVVPSMVDTSALGYSNGGLTMYDANCRLMRLCAPTVADSATIADERMAPVGVKAKL